MTYILFLPLPYVICTFYISNIYLPASRGGRVLPVTEVGDVGDEPVVDLVESESLVWGGEDGLDYTECEDNISLLSLSILDLFNQVRVGAVTPRVAP